MPTTIKNIVVQLQDDAGAWIDISGGWESRKEAEQYFPNHRTKFAGKPLRVIERTTVTTEEVL